jgi:hypothetical protein
MTITDFENTGNVASYPPDFSPTFDDVSRSSFETRRVSYTSGQCQQGRESPNRDPLPRFDVGSADTFLTGVHEMPNRPQDPPEESYSLHMAPGVCRPTSPPPPRKREPATDLQAMREMWLKSVEYNACLRVRNEALSKEVRRLTIAVGKYECSACGAERSASRAIHPVSSDPVCEECGECWL